MEPKLKISDEIVKQFSERLGAFKDVIEATEKSSDEDSGTFEMIITTENVDRMGEVIKMEGWEFENYMKNPVVLWGHDHYDLPLGVTLSIEKVDGKVIAKGRFAPESANPKAQQVRKLYDAGIARASSVGFIEKEREGNLITKAELIEWSFVNVPANPMALSALIKSGISIDEMVTKGFVTVKEEVDTVQEPQDPPDDATIDITGEEEKAFRKAVIDLLNEIKTIALEASIKAEPERKEDDDLEMKEFRAFSEKRKVLQDASTVISEVLAEARKAFGPTR